MMTLEHYLNHERLYVALMLAVYLLVNNSILATSILMEAERAGNSLPVTQPFITEYTSAIAFFVLFPLVLWAAKRFPFAWGFLRRQAVVHLGFSVLFCLAHVVLFVVLRKLVFALQDLNYQFSDDPFMTFIYEYRKDAWAYLFTLIAIHSYRFILSRLRGEAVPVGEGEDEESAAAPQRFLVRKLGKEFIVRTGDIEWLEAAGNYVNLHVADRVYPLRATMARLIDSLEQRGFVRIHRSQGVNLEFVESITPLESGDSLVSMKSGRKLNLSRRYRDGFRTKLGRRLE